MNLLIPDWKIFGKEDLVCTLETMGHTVFLYQEEPREYRHDPKYRSTLRKFLREKQIDCIFSMNFYPILSNVCKECQLLYISWCYDCPLVMTYSETVFNSCNRLFLFDSQMVKDLQTIGVAHAYYMPLAVNPERLHQLHANEESLSLLKADVSFVGSLYYEKHNLFERLSSVSDYTKGYLEGIMQAQRSVYGCHFLSSLLPNHILQDMVATAPLTPHRNSYETLEYLYANYFLCREITRRDRLEVMTRLNEIPTICTKLYTPNPTPELTHIHNMGTVQYQNEMPLVFRHSKINLNITLRSIQNGIPLRAMDIMGAGGFLLTNHQNDFLLHFTEGEDYICYTDFDDMIDKITYFLQHEDERNAIAANGHKKVCQNHTYQQTLTKIFDLSLQES